MIIPDKNTLSTCDLHPQGFKERHSATVLVLCGYLKKAMGMGEVTVGMAALIELLQQSRDAMPLGPFISLLEQASWELQHTHRGNLK